MTSNKFLVGAREINELNPTYFIADIGANHDGDLNRALTLIELAAEAGADAAKFQHFRAETIVSDFGFAALGRQQSHQAAWRKTVFQVYKEASLDMDWTARLVERCQRLGIDFLTSPYDLGYVDFLDSYLAAYKVGSGDITWTEMLEKIASKGKPIFLATGASRSHEVEAAVNLIGRFGNPLALLQCNTNYTGSKQNYYFINLNVLRTFQKLFPGVVLGLSDHTPGSIAAFGAVALGARVIEKHFTDDKTRLGPDHGFSLEPNEWKEMVQQIRLLESTLGDGIKRVEENERETVVLQRRSLRVVRDLSQGHVLSSEDLLALRPAPLDSIPPNQSSDVIGRKLKRDCVAGDYVRWSDLLT